MKGIKTLKLKVQIVIIATILLIGVFVLNSSDNEKWTVYRNVSPFGEKTIVTNSELRQLKGIIENLGDEFERDNQFMKSGGVYLVQLNDGDVTISYNFFGNDVQYVEKKNDERLIEKWYRSDEEILSKIDDLFKALNLCCRKSTHSKLSRA